MYSYDSNGNEPKCHFCLLERVEENECFIDKYVSKGTSEYVKEMEKGIGLSEITS